MVDLVPLRRNQIDQSPALADDLVRRRVVVATVRKRDRTGPVKAATATIPHRLFRRRGTQSGLEYVASLAGPEAT